MNLPNVNLKISDTEAEFLERLLLRHGFATEANDLGLSMLDKTALRDKIKTARGYYQREYNRRRGR